MNKRSVQKSWPLKASRSTAVRKSAVRKAPVRVVATKPETNGVAVSIAAVSVVQVVSRTQVLRTHKYRVGQTVSYTSSPISRPGASGSYKVVRLLPSDGEDYQYRIKNPGEAFERVAKESQLDLDH